MMSLRQVNKQDCNCDQANIHLHVEIENLKQRLVERERHIVKMETNFLKESDKFPNGELAAIMDELITWQEKYSRLYESHKRVQKVNQGLEDKLLKMVDKCETEKNLLHSEITSITKKLIEQQSTLNRLQDENERYRQDLNIALQLLQCKPSNFIPQKFDLLPHELQCKVKSYIGSKHHRRFSFEDNEPPKKPELKTIKVPIPTFPPTAMVYSLNSDKEQNTNETNKKPTTVDIVSAAIMAKVLKEREKERLTKHCQTCSCQYSDNTINVDINNKTEAICNSGKNDEDLISFDGPPMDSGNKTGPWPCSVRMQVGSNNILLDNAVQYSRPILYKRRDASEPLVHGNSFSDITDCNNKQDTTISIPTETKI